ncbi:hypothetical protein [Paenibacillus radicis (ex Gao et al. 2016)]|uniref:Uncharacterized protein n=1 Tax=Paenibacillus radicis (ex Gao et al. 2016) TaxID=1737354 RepID=A0A917H7U4_9BACL|nr:hypothetical protein [Paenibacillus radicis (ex Gao et al. 2016)]GGG70293.1 hypothetical protein GCM10010918_27000 [Paenibacillus radicis (ex Gao et al. 2016)]
MKLNGSITEQDFRHELMKSHEQLFNDVAEGRSNLSLLQEHFSDLVTAYSLHRIPEQGEDIVTYLINTDIIALIETNRNDSSIEPIIETIAVSDYLMGLSKIKRIKLAVALEMAREDIMRSISSAPAKNHHPGMIDTNQG